MTPLNKWEDLAIEEADHIAIIEIRRPPHNYFDRALVASLAGAFEYVDDCPDLRVIVLAAQGKSFCAGASFSGDEGEGRTNAEEVASILYKEALRLFATRKPIVAAVQGSAIGGGLGLSLVADFRVAAPEARFSANFVKIGISPGFGLTYTLPRLIGQQSASLLLYTGRRIDSVTALEVGLVDEVVPIERLRPRAVELAKEIAENAPMAVEATRETMRAGVLNALRSQIERETRDQGRLFKTKDFREGVRAVGERRSGRFQRR